MFTVVKNGKIMDLKRVVIVKHETCKTYAFKRIGLVHLLSMENDKPRIEDLVNGGMFKQLVKPEKEALVLWLDDTTQDFYESVEIDKRGRVVCDRVIVYGHFGVYEGGEMVSDVIGSDLYPIVRQRRYKNLRKADYIIKYVKKKTK